MPAPCCWLKTTDAPAPMWVPPTGVSTPSTWRRAGIEWWWRPGHPSRAHPWRWTTELRVLSADGRVLSADPRTGERKVLFQMGAAAAGMLSAALGTVFATDTRGRVHAIDATDGRLKWPLLPTGGLVLAAPLPVAAWLYVCGTDGVLREIGIEDGHQRATDNLGAALHVTPAYDGNRLYVGASNGVVHAYDIGHRGLVRQEPIWRSEVGEEIAGIAVSGRRVYVAAGNRLVEVDSATKKDRELLRMDCLIGVPVISGRYCYIAGLGGVVICVALRLFMSDRISDPTRNNQDAR